MACSTTRGFFYHKRVFNDTNVPLHSSPAPITKLLHYPNRASLPNAAVSRRGLLLFSVLPFNLALLPLSSEARDRRGRKTIPPEDYMTSSDGLKYYDLIEGNGSRADNGSTVQVHFDCLYRGITAISSRESKILAGNRIIAQAELFKIQDQFQQAPLDLELAEKEKVAIANLEKDRPYVFTVGSPPGKERKREFSDNVNGLFSAQAAPKPPPAMYSITEGMRVGGKRTVIVPPEVGYGQKGLNEIPPGATFELNVELLQVLPPATK